MIFEYVSIVRLIDLDDLPRKRQRWKKTDKWFKLLEIGIKDMYQAPNSQCRRDTWRHIWTL